MTVITEILGDLAGVPESAPVVFWTEQVRQNELGNAIVTKRRHSFVPVFGTLTTSELDPGPALVKIGPDTFHIEVPDSVTPVRLWPLIEASLGPVAGTPTTGFVRDGGGITRTQAVSLAQFSSITKDPATVYFIYEEGAL